MSQDQRDRVMGRLRSGTADLLIATDVAARGLDIEQLTHVVNYNVPSAAEAYVHRIGRVGRAGREGVAITLAEPREHRMLKTIEQLTKQRFTIEKLPTVADLRTRRLEMTRAALQESLVADDRLDRFRVVIESLAEEFDIMDIALAAVKLAHEASGGELDEQEIPDHSEAITRKPQRSEPERRDGRRGSRSDGDTTRLFFGVGRRSGIRPQDLVGAIANESRLSGRDIGAIEIADRFSLVEVPSSAADEVIDALRHSTIKGKKATVRREGYTPARRQGRSRPIAPLAKQARRMGRSRCGAFGDRRRQAGGRTRVEDQREHDLGRVVGQRTTVETGESVAGRCADDVRHDVREQLSGDASVRSPAGSSAVPIAATTAAIWSPMDLPSAAKSADGCRSLAGFEKSVSSGQKSRPHHRVSEPVDLPPSAGVGGEFGGAPDADVQTGAQQRMRVRDLEHDGLDRGVREAVGRVLHSPCGTVDRRRRS